MARLSGGKMNPIVEAMIKAPICEQHQELANALRPELEADGDEAWASLATSVRVCPQCKVNEWTAGVSAIADEHVYRFSIPRILRAALLRAVEVDDG
jgi:hypothetical protein